MKPTSPLFSEISEEALFLYKQILDDAAGNAVIKFLCKGYPLLLSPFVNNLKTLLVGFNPGW